jgi:large subunit ribosomal protein L49
LQDIPEKHNPLKALGTKEDLPFHVSRTASYNLPVYIAYKHKRTSKNTVIKKVSGDVEELMRELRKVCSNHEI